MKISVIDFLIETTRKQPTKTAIEDANGTVSFETLLSNGCNLAEAISNLHIQRSPIAVFLPKSKEMIECFAGINLSGNLYVPLDTTQPSTRIENILGVLGSSLVVTSNTLKEKLPATFKGEILIIEDIFQNGNDWQRAIQMLEDAAPIDTDPVYAIFTSGSTGMPKGVVVNHRGVIDYIDWAVETFGVDSSYIIGNQAPFYFDNSTLDIYLMYATGATLVIIPEDRFTFPAKLIEFLNEKRINFVFWVPFILVNIANFKLLERLKPEYLKNVFFAGEVMPTRQLNYWRKHLPHCRYVNLYGPTEITVDCTYFIIDREFNDDEPLPIGKPCRNTDILILRDRKEPCKKGETGEICVRGSSLANGYYNNPAKTEEAFIQNPLNQAYPEKIYCTGDLGYLNERSEIIFVGRIDSQIKHKGYRIELGEIETAVQGSHLVEECCVVYDNAKQRITLFYSNDEAITPAQLRTALKDRIPAYMLPSTIIREGELKRNTNGKIDRLHYKTKLDGV